MGTQARPVSVRPLGAGGDRDFVVEMTSPIARNVLYRAYRALCAIGVQVLHTRLRMRGDDAVETLHLTEVGDASLNQGRVFEVLAVLNAVCEAKIFVQPSRLHEHVDAVGGE